MQIVHPSPRSGCAGIYGNPNFPVPTKN